MAIKIDLDRSEESSNWLKQKKPPAEESENEKSVEALEEKDSAEVSLAAFQRAIKKMRDETK